MALIAGIDLPREKRVDIGLTYIFGVGRVSAVKILNEAGIDGAIGLEFDWLADARLVLTDELVAESLRARKHAASEAGLGETQFDDVETEQNSDGGIEAPALRKDA